MPIMALPDDADFDNVEWEYDLSRRQRRDAHVDDLGRPGHDWLSRKKRRAEHLRREADAQTDRMNRAKAERVGEQIRRDAVIIAQDRAAAEYLLGYR